MNHSELTSAAEGMGETIVILKRQRDELIAQVSFLLDRLADFENEIWDVTTENEYAGHVAPAIARLKVAIKNVTGE